MKFSDIMLSQNRPDSLKDFSLPRRQTYFPSPADWRDEILYFLLPDRFSDGQEALRPLLSRQDLSAARPPLPDGKSWQWESWAISGADHWQGGNLRGILSQLGYLKDLGVNALWIGPIFKQRGHLDTYHGYGIQDFLEVDPRFGNRQELVDLVDAAHAQGLRVILDIIFNHSGSNWLYPPETPGGPFRPIYTQGSYPFGSWRGDQGEAIDAIRNREDGAWPVELQDLDCYTRAGKGALDKGDIDDPQAEFRRTDFEDLRDFRLERQPLLNDLARCYKYWIALTDVDGFRIDTLKHVSLEEGRNFCGTIKEFAANLGKSDFFLLGEVAGGDKNEERYLNVLERNLNATLDISEMRLSLNAVAKGLAHPSAYFDGFNPSAIMGSHRNLGLRHVSVLDDHDHVWGTKVRFSSEASSDHQVVGGVALQLFTLGIPCIYYGTEQAFAGPEVSERKWLPDWGGSDRYLREAMFGPEHPRKRGTAGAIAAPAGLDDDLPGFGPFGTSGHHCFDQDSPVYKRIAALIKCRQNFPVLRYGRQYLRPISLLGWPFAIYGGGQIIAWSRILDDEEALCLLNPHGTEDRGADVIVDANLNATNSSRETGTMMVLVNTAQALNPLGYSGTHPVGSTVPVLRKNNISYVEIREIPPSEVLVLTNHPTS